ncbi:MAG TPA: hypothetical protein P5210_15555, partial [Draconibacterium sp.]|nr:hypothetical protein [Draconibacterium sp.]
MKIHNHSYLTNKTTTLLFIIFSLSPFLIFAQTDKNSLELLSAGRIWDKAPHNAFTDLVRFNNQFFCVFREGEKHVSADGALRVITSK